MDQLEQEKEVQAKSQEVIEAVRKLGGDVMVIGAFKVNGDTCLLADLQGDTATLASALARIITNPKGAKVAQLLHTTAVIAELVNDKLGKGREEFTKVLNQ